MECIQISLQQFSWKQKFQNYRELVNELLKAYENMKCNISLKQHFLSSHLDFSPQNLGAVSSEQGERFHHGTEICWKLNVTMLADYCWKIVKHTEEMKYK